ncbi:MAG: Type 1 glutamine amidotransferase-like domain-containing protein [Planctomycetaceae bacterium]|nr:Type 1 glutamine amidotransferase-like domain-containing protein [Planctomycetaceae bacterium]
MRSASWIILIVAFCRVVSADDNVLGLPAPRNAEHPGAVVLHGGGRISEDVFERFIELAGGKEARIVFVPSAGWRPSDYQSESAFLDVIRSRFSSWVALGTNKRVKNFQFLYTDSPRAAESATFVKPLETATGVWFSGGDQARLNYRFVGNFPSQTKFQIALRQILERGGVVGGTSAGTAAIPEVMTLWHEYEDFDAPATAVAAHGLGVLTSAIVEQHFDARGGRLERFTGLLRDNDKLDRLTGRDGVGVTMLGLAVEERSALIVRGDHLQVLGGANAHVFAKSNQGKTLIWHELAPGEAAELKRDRTGSVELRRGK